MSLEKLDLIVKSADAKLCLMDDVLMRFKRTTSITGLFNSGTRWPSTIRYERSEGIGKKGSKTSHQVFDEVSAFNQARCTM